LAFGHNSSFFPATRGCAAPLSAHHEQAIWRCCFPVVPAVSFADHPVHSTALRRFGYLPQATFPLCTSRLVCTPEACDPRQKRSSATSLKAARAPPSRRGTAQADGSGGQHYYFRRESTRSHLPHSPLQPQRCLLSPYESATPLPIRIHSFLRPAPACG
jgi:hypothetical protein